MEDDHFSYKKPLSKWLLRKMNNKIIKYKICKNLKSYIHIREKKKTSQYYFIVSIPVRRAFPHRFFALTPIYARPEGGKVLRTGRLGTQKDWAMMNSGVRSRWLRAD